LEIFQHSQRANALFSGPIILLKICGAEPEHIIEEYHLSIGTEKRNHIEITLNGFADLDSYFSGIDLEKIRASLIDLNT
jgi:hypothetical protein